MKLPFKFVRMSMIAHATEDKDKLKGVLRTLFPEEVEIEESEAEGHYGDSKIILSSEIRKRPFLRKFWDQVLERLPKEEKKRLAEEAVERIAEDCRLYLRFDKQLAVSDEKLKLTEAGDVLHVRMNISAYPAKREIAVQEIKEFIDSGLEY